MTAAQDGNFGEFIQTDGDDLTVTGLKYGIGFKPASTRARSRTTDSARR